MSKDQDDLKEITKNEETVVTRQDEDLTPFMSDAEREALMGDDNEAVTLKQVMEGLRPDPEGEDTDPLVDDGDDDVSSQGNADDPAKQDPAKPAEVATAAQNDEAPAITAAPVENLEGEVAKLEAAKAKVREDQSSAEEKLREKLESADIEPDEYNKEVAKLRTEADKSVEAISDQRRDLLDQDKNYRRQLEGNQNWYKNQWIKESNAFVTAAKAEGIDYTDPAKPLLARALNDEIARLNQAQPNLTNLEILKSAHQAVITQLGITPTKAKGGKAKPFIPPSIANMPSSMQINPEQSNAKFSKADNASGFDLEMAVAGMSEAEQDAWLKAS